MGYRHRARERALQCLYQWEVTGKDPERLFEGFWAAQPESAQVVEFAERLIRGTVAEIEAIDPLIDRQATNWRLDRMGNVDRNILRLGVYELLNEPDTPAAVVINEAIELAKRFSGSQAGPFVNGVLDGIRRRLEGRVQGSGNDGPAEPVAGDQVGQND